MIADIARIREAIGHYRTVRDPGHVKAVLRGEFQSWLCLIFPDTTHKNWINNYTEGAEG